MQGCRLVGNDIRLQDYLVCTAFAKASILPTWLNSVDQVKDGFTVVAV
ncbi:hypothetical protein [Pseudoalteromonas xiamenensis]|uniref:Uncharacterized protein n=1 Tax=Pseudoalteromonas xiamenensis TaxID=882626 RepID=A0A975DEG4_9GAMM|nr:hypothetical protein [Pseudoalteromonas xiamenensis]QTH70262.1 hypothetical protein J5O05_09470 [Pseudoalteromonas xiamenensis]